MDQPERKRLSRRSLFTDALMTLAVFAYFTWVLKGHVPSNDPFDMWFWGAVSASCMAAVFWLGLQMFKVVLREQRADRKK